MSDRAKVISGAALAGLLVVALIIGVWAFKVATSDVKGRGDAVQTKNSSANRIRAQEEYVETYNEVLAADKRIDIMQAALDASPGSQVAQTNLTGSETYCVGVVKDYDALIDKYTSADFIPDGYPEQIDSLDPTTDCMPTQK